MDEDVSKYIGALDDEAGGPAQGLADGVADGVADKVTDEIAEIADQTATEGVGAAPFIAPFTKETALMNGPKKLRSAGSILGSGLSPFLKPADAEGVGVALGLGKKPPMNGLKNLTSSFSICVKGSGLELGVGVGVALVKADSRNGAKKKRSSSSI